MKTALCALLLLVAPAFADKSPPLLDLAHAAEMNNGLWISADRVNPKDHKGQFRFSIFTRTATTAALLEILIEPPDSEQPEVTRYHFDYDGIEYPIAENVYQSGNSYLVYLPELKAGMLVEFSLGLDNLNFAKSGAIALLTYDDGQKSAVWNGSKR